MKNATNLWVKEFSGAVTTSDSKGIILELNDKALEAFRDQGGEGLIGTNVLNCHPEPARTKTKKLMEKRQVNIYTTEKNGAWQLIYQSPWYVNGEYRGFVELSLDIPAKIPHFIRD